MRRRRALIVGIVAGVGEAVVAVGLETPESKVWARKAQAPVERKSDPGNVTPLSPSDDVPRPSIPAAPTAESEPDPLPPAVEPASRRATAAARVLPSPSSPAAANLTDPEGAARAFVEKSTREADEAIKALTLEAESLRARLQKVEAGLARWQAVKSALEANANGARPAWRTRGDSERDPFPPGGRVIPGEVLPARPSPGSPFDLDSAPAPVRVLPSDTGPDLRPIDPAPDARPLPTPRAVTPATTPAPGAPKVEASPGVN